MRVTTDSPCFNVTLFCSKPTLCLRSRAWRIVCRFSAVEEQEEKWQISQIKGRDKLRTKTNGVLEEQLTRNKYKAWA